ncbi:MAG: UvrD-helicase domain-containing protein [Verrucomicrobiales bacterium]|nr:UvrD-helicase domain-containing protein [Verrucomicrobiales bacterium]
MSDLLDVAAVSQEEAIPNEMILASAGSGKTYQLTNRYIALMGLDLLQGNPVTPERIVAVTFTRKAAGEFFDSILKKLAKAAGDPKGAEELCPPPEDPLFPVMSKLGQTEYRRLLRVFLDRMPRLFLNTLDSFFANILRAFPAEFGLAGDFEIIDDHLAAVARQQVYRSVFQPPRRGEEGGGQDQFLEAFRRATFGRERSRIRQSLDSFVDFQHEIYLHAGSGDKWGNPSVIWPKGTPWLGTEVNLEDEFCRLFEIFCSEANVTDSQMDFWHEFRDDALNWVPGSYPSSRIRYFLKRILERWGELEQGDTAFPVNRKRQQILDEACDVLHGIITHLVGEELKTRLQRTRGTWEILAEYEKTYSRLVRRRGRLTFQDMELILAGHEFGSDLPRPMLSQIPGPEERLRIDYRLDAQYDHWLLDEFQDTNYVQWEVIKNLIDEAVQDVSDERSLFQVGDIKQAIYAWRGGDTRLFHDIYDHYKGDGTNPRIKPRELNVSWRSGHDIISMVNRIFQPDPHFSTMEIPSPAINRWKWQDHLVAPTDEQQNLPGYCGWINPIAAEDEKMTEEDRFRVVVSLLDEIQPIERGISCAILAQTNSEGRKIVDYIRAHSDSKIPVMSEADISPATDNPLTLALLSLFRFAAHPGDTFAWEHVAMTPFADVFENEDLTRGAVASRVLRQVFDKGFEFTLRHWISELERQGVELRPFARRRSEDLALAARLFDQSGSRDLDEFLAYAEKFTVREPDTKSAVQVMTIHKSKGLTFDMVILPDLGGKKLTFVRKSIGVSRNKHRQVEWVLDLPQSEIVAADDVLSRYRDAREAEAAYEELCKFYVALTRARQANYLITEPRGKSATSKNFVMLLEKALGTGSKTRRTIHDGLEVDFLYESDEATTDWNWFSGRERNLPPAASADGEIAPVSIPVTGPPRPRPKRRTPSGSETQIVTANQLFGRAGRKARAYGTLVHALFEEIEWLDEIEPDELDRRFGAVDIELDSYEKDQAIEEVESCLQFDEVREALSRPSPTAECWLERRFEIFLKNEWLSGTFDRVVVEPGQSATILDFKTDRIDFDDDEKPEAKIEGYRPQLETYREVLTRMTGIPPENIATKLLFTKLKRVVSV